MSAQTISEGMQRVANPSSDVPLTVRRTARPNGCQVKSLLALGVVLTAPERVYPS